MKIEVASSVVGLIERFTQQEHPKEACGILLGLNNRVNRLWPAKNVHEKPITNFEIDPQTLIDVHREMRDQDEEILGYFHSHPKGLAMPSVVDQDRALRNNLLWAIKAPEQIRIWRDAHDGFVELPFEIFEDQE